MKPYKPNHGTVARWSSSACLLLLAIYGLATLYSWPAAFATPLIRVTDWNADNRGSLAIVDDRAEAEALPEEGEDETQPHPEGVSVARVFEAAAQTSGGFVDALVYMDDGSTEQIELVPSRWWREVGDWYERIPERWEGVERVQLAPTPVVAEVWWEQPVGGMQGFKWGLLVCLALGAVSFGGVYWLHNKPNAADFLIETESELRKVTWTWGRELLQTSGVVILCTLVFAVFLFAVDLIFSKLSHLTGVIPEPQDLQSMLDPGRWPGIF